MKPDATLWDALPTLKDPHGYVDRVLIRMNECAAAHGEAYLRLGTSPQGKGLYPSFRVTYHAGGEEKIFDSYNDNGTSFPKPYDKIVPGDWSTTAMGIHEVIAGASEVGGALLMPRGT